VARAGRRGVAARARPISPTRKDLDTGLAGLDGARADVQASGEASPPGARQLRSGCTRPRSTIREINCSYGAMAAHHGVGILSLIGCHAGKCSDHDPRRARRLTLRRRIARLPCTRPGDGLLRYEEIAMNSDRLANQPVRSVRSARQRRPSLHESASALPEIFRGMTTVVRQKIKTAGLATGRRRARRDHSGGVFPYFARRPRDLRKAMRSRAKGCCQPDISLAITTHGNCGGVELIQHTPGGAVRRQNVELSSRSLFPQSVLRRVARCRQSFIIHLHPSLLAL
jgi:hypothetical protein